jgi:hypothetical protein
VATRSSLKVVRQFIAAASLAIIAVGCSGSPNDDAVIERPEVNETSDTTSLTQDTIVETTVPRSTTTTTTVPLTTIVESGKDATAELRTLATSMGARDFSEISDSACGKFAMVLADVIIDGFVKGGLFWYWWDGSQWVDKSDQLKGGIGDYHLRVYTRDYTNDGIKEFFVVAKDSERRSAKEFGSFFGFGWSPQSQCRWDWMVIDNGRETVTAISEPEPSPRSAKVFCVGYRNSSTRIRGWVWYDSSISAFRFDYK